jgi:hypothetical protein
MAKLPEIKGGLTSNGNLKTQVHQNLKEQYAAKVSKALGLRLTPNGDFAIEIATADGATVYARVDYAITTTNPFVDKKKSKEKDIEIGADIRVPKI